MRRNINNEKLLFFKCTKMANLEDVFEYIGGPFLDISQVNNQVKIINGNVKYIHSQLINCNYQNKIYFNKPYGLLVFNGLNINNNVYTPLKININQKCPIPFELLISYYFLASISSIITIKVNNEVLELEIKNNNLSMCYKNSENRWSSCLYEININNPLWTSYCARAANLSNYTSTIELDFEKLLPKFFTHSVLTPYGLYSLLYKNWGINIRLNENLVNTCSLIPFLFEGFDKFSENNRIYKATFCIPNFIINEQQWINLFSNIIKIKTIQYEIRPLIKTAYSDPSHIYLNLVIVSHSVLEDASIFNVDNNIAIPNKISLYGLNHLYTYVYNVFHTAIYLDEDREKLLQRFNVREYSAIIDILDNIEP